MQKDKILQWINKNDFWKNEFVNYRNSNLDILFNPKHKDVKNKFDYYQSVYGYVTFEENISKYNPLDCSDESFTEYREMNKLYNSSVDKRLPKKANPENEFKAEKSKEVKIIIDKIINNRDDNLNSFLTEYLKRPDKEKALPLIESKFLDLFLNKKEYLYTYMSEILKAKYRISLTAGAIKKHFK